MNELWNIAKAVAKENERLVLAASLRELAQLMVVKAAENGLVISPPSPSHMNYILNRIGYVLPKNGSHKGFVYKHNGGRDE